MNPVEIFFSYSHQDEKLLNRLRNHLAELRRQGIISDWYDRKIQAGEEWEGQIDEHIRAAKLIIFLVSANFMASDYVNDAEVRLAMERHEAGKATVIPVILAPVLWEQAVFGKLQALPRNGKPVSSWRDRNAAFVDIARGIQHILDGNSEEPVKRSSDSPALPQVQADPGAPRRRKKKNLIRALLVTATCLALALILLRPQALRSPFRRQKGDRPGLAVLPTSNLSGAQGSSESMTETLISCIGSEQVRVISHQSVIRYKNSDKPLPQIAQELGVEMIVQSSIRQSGNRVYITSQLYRASPEERIWSNDYMTELGDQLHVQCEVAEAISKKIETRIGAPAAKGHGGEQRCASCRAGVNPGAHEAYVQGRNALNRRGGGEGFASARTYLEEALKSDPNYAPAHAALADLYSISSYYGLFSEGITSLEESLEQAEFHAKKALEIDSDLADAHTSMGIVQLFYKRDWRQAEKSFRRAIELDQNSADAYYFYWFALFSRGQTAQAAEQIRLAFKLNPLSPNICMNVGLQDMIDGKYEKALELIQKAQHLEPAYSGSELYLSILYRRQNNEDLEFQHFRNFLELRYPEIIPEIKQSYETGGRQAALVAAAQELELISTKGRPIPPEDIARVYLRLGDHGKALDWLEKSFKQNFPAAILFGASGEWESLRSEPRFRALLSNILGNQGNGQTETPPHSAP